MKPMPSSPLPARPSAGDPINETLMRRIVDAVRAEALKRPMPPGPASRFGVTMPHNGNYPADNADALVYPFRFVGLKNVDDKTTGEFLQKATESAADWDTSPIGDISTIPDGFAVNVAAAHYGATTDNYVEEGDLVQVNWNGSYFELDPVVSGGGSAQIILFELIDDESSGSGSGSIDSSGGSSNVDAVPDACEDRIPSSSNYIGKVQRKGCDMGEVPGMDSDGNVELVDAIGLLDDRDYRDLPGRQGYAVFMDLGDISSVGSSASISITRCQWLIVSMNFWRAVSVVTDIIFGAKSITVKRRNLTVWDDCGLPDEIIEGIDCEEESSSSSGSGSV